MKFSLTAGRQHGAVSNGARGGAHRGAGTFRFNDERGFTMMEIAISLAIIGIALVAIIGVLPIGMNVQQDNRQETIINQDAAVLVEDLRNGSVGMNELTNYVVSITNWWSLYSSGGTQSRTGVSNWYTYYGSFVAK